MTKLLARTTLALALAGVAVPALACEMKHQTTTAATQEKSSEKKAEKAEKKAENEKKPEKTAGTVADAKR